MVPSGPAFETGRDRSRAITGDDILAAQEQLILNRVTHLDQLADKLREERVRRVIEPLLTGASEDESSTPDLEYVRDLGLIARDDPPCIANPIYAEVVPRELTYAVQAKLLQDTAWYVDADGGLNVDKLLADFQKFFRAHSEHWAARFDYAEAGPQLLLQAFLQRIVNSGGRIEREYGLGRGRTDLLIIWPQGDGSPPHAAGRFVIECKVLHEGLERTISEGLEQQTAGYMGPLCRAGGSSGDLRSQPGEALGGEDLPPRGSGGRPHDHGMGHIGRGVAPVMRASPSVLDGVRAAGASVPPGTAPRRRLRWSRSLRWRARRAREQRRPRHTLRRPCGTCRRR